MADTPAQDWDRHSIKAEIERRGGTLSGISRGAGLYDAACRLGLAGQNYAGALAISRWLGVPFGELFRGMYRTKGVRREPIRKTSRAASQKRARPADAARAS